MGYDMPLTTAPSTKIGIKGDSIQPSTKIEPIKQARKNHNIGFRVFNSPMAPPGLLGLTQRAYSLLQMVIIIRFYPESQNQIIW